VRRIDSELGCRVSGHDALLGLDSASLACAHAAGCDACTCIGQNSNRRHDAAPLRSDL
jgi:hypothetical protein